jgi:predicted O-methyltransferase YrrM
MRDFVAGISARAFPESVVRGVSDTRRTLGAVRQQARIVLSLRVLPRPVACFFWRAYRHARRTGDSFSLASAARPAELAELLALARSHDTVVELGTGTAWSAIALALDDRRRQVITYDPCVRDEREAYLDLAGSSVRARIDLREEPDSNGPRSADPPVPMLFIDSSHEREAVMAAFRAWSDALGPRAVVAFHDFDHPDHPGVREAVVDLQLLGRKSGGLFVWQAP